ncbi:hypothetical protein [Dawidia soli]|uniref:Uncharacterized protein n=1 Tax=Dawidia soli TaxID=2782352 RepID=A0AAP2D9Z3_9BACT|nr:hypothetical protein [Dawidia soli]MBT1685332.1 hypothetical protein [Dawidia soli]
MRQYIVFALSILAITSCSIKRTGEKAGEVVGEFVKGASSGVQRPFKVEVKLSDPLKQKGLTLGKILIASDTLGVDNLVSVYCIFKENFQDTLVLKAFDNDGLETGRSRLPITAQKGGAGYYDFPFDRRTNLDATDCQLVLEQQ